jgi:hypothetical protein
MIKDWVDAVQVVEIKSDAFPLNLNLYAGKRLVIVGS